MEHGYIPMSALKVKKQRRIAVLFFPSFFFSSILELHCLEKKNKLVQVSVVPPSGRCGQTNIPGYELKKSRLNTGRR